MSPRSGRVPALVSVFSVVAVALAPAQVREVRVLQAPSESHFGYALSSIDDLDGDGVRDLLVGAPSGFSPYSLASVFVFSGKTGTLLRHHLKSAGFGETLTSLGDVTGDGIADYAVGASEEVDPNDSSVEVGAVYVFSGAGGGELFHLTSNGRRFGEHVADAGDFDGDGRDDLIVTASKQGGFTRGRVLCFSTASGSPLWALVGESQHDEFGSGFAVVGDVDGDLVPDFAVGATEHAASASSAGRIYLYSGATRSLLWSVDGTAPAKIGRQIAAAGDANQDGVPDVAFTRPFTATTAPVVEVVSGVDGSSILTLALSDAFALAGSSIGDAVDVDGDGDRDLLLGGSFVTGPFTPRYLDLRVVDPSSAAELVRYVGPLANVNTFDTFVLAPASDLDGDGFADLLAGAPNDGDGTVRILAFRSPPTLSSIAPVRGRYDAATPVTISGGGFALAQGLTVDLGGFLANDVAVVDDQTLTCTVPSGATGPIDVTIADDAGSATLASGFARTPAVLLDGTIAPGSTFVERYLCDPNDTLLGIWGVPPPVSIPTRPFDGALAILPFTVQFVVAAWPVDEFDLSIDLPNDASLSGLQFLVQALVGPKLTGRNKSGAWTNAALLQIK
jgi:hypothetical protein